MFFADFGIMKPWLWVGTHIQCWLLEIEFWVLGYSVIPVAKFRNAWQLPFQEHESTAKPLSGSSTPFRRHGHDMLGLVAVTHNQNDHATRKTETCNSSCPQNNATCGMMNSERECDTLARPPWIFSLTPVSSRDANFKQLVLGCMDAIYNLLKSSRRDLQNTYLLFTYLRYQKFSQH